MLEDLLNYTAAADRKIMEAIRNNPDCGDQAIKVFSHILNAQHIWISRVFGKTPLYDRMQTHSPDVFPEFIQANSAGLKLIFDTVPLQQVLRYTISTGEEFQNTIEEILYHTVNHSTYHRGQVASQLRQHGIDPPATDLIVLKRNGELK